MAKAKNILTLKNAFANAQTSALLVSLCYQQLFLSESSRSLYYTFFIINFLVYNRIIPNVFPITCAFIFTCYSRATIKPKLERDINNFLVCLKIELCSVLVIFKHNFRNLMSENIAIKFSYFSKRIFICLSKGRKRLKNNNYKKEFK